MLEHPAQSTERGVLFWLNVLTRWVTLKELTLCYRRLLRNLAYCWHQKG